MDVKTIMPSPVVKAKTLYLNTRNSRIGFSSFNCLVMNKNNEMVPIIIDNTTCKLSQPMSPAELKPYSNPPKPNVDKMIDKTSTFGFVCFVTFVNKKYAVTIFKI